jgi:hypothetical protein
MNLAETLAAFREAGVVRGFYDEKRGVLRVQFGHLLPVASSGGDAPALVDAKGNPVDLDEGMGPLERDPIDDANHGKGEG